MDSSSNIDQVDKNFGLTEKLFLNLVEKLKQGDEELIELYYLKYFKNCCRYLQNSCSAEEEMAYESTMDALIELRKELVNDRVKYGNLNYYFTYRAKMRLINRQKKVSNRIKTTNIEDFDFQDENNLQEVFNENESQIKINQALKTLSVEEQEIMKLHYFEEMSFVEIGEKLNIKISTIRQKAKRSRDKIKPILEQLLFNNFQTAQ